MRLSVIQRILGFLFMMHSVTMLPPLLVGCIYAESEWAEFLFTFGVLFLVGAAIWWPVRAERRELRARDGFIIVVMFWTVLGVVGAIPFMFMPHLSFSNAVFESVSGFITTGATVITGLDSLPKSSGGGRRRRAGGGGGG